MLSVKKIFMTKFVNYFLKYAVNKINSGQVITFSHFMRRTTPNDHPLKIVILLVCFLSDLYI